MFECGECGTSFSSSRGLHTHQGRAHGSKTGKTSRIRLNAVEEEEEAPLPPPHRGKRQRMAPFQMMDALTALSRSQRTVPIDVAQFLCAYCCILTDVVERLAVEGIVGV